MDSVIEYAEKLPERIKQTGIRGEGPAEIKLTAGVLKMVFSNGALRYISAGENELIRMIYSAVRDRDWLTVTPEIEYQKIEVKDNSFLITMKCIYKSKDINYSADYFLEGRQDNSICLSMEGKALDRFEKNRIGFCILHPVDSCAGINCVIEHTDGSSEQSFFPEDISPHQAFRDIRAIIWHSKRSSCRIDFEGDIFETEDQRNWTDASFKTYSTPLSIPFPVTVEKGTRIFQKIIFRTNGYSDISENKADLNLVRLFPDEQFRLPSIGICRSGTSQPLSKNEIRILRSVHFDHYRVDLHLYESKWQTIAREASLESSDLGYPLEIALFFDDNFPLQIKDFIKWLSERKNSFSSVLLFHKSYPSTPDELSNEVIPLLKAADPDIKIVTGTNANFAQLNRTRPGETGNDSICYSIQPQEHASDNATLVENLKAQEYSVISARRFAGKKEILISPVTIQRRFNASNTFVELPWPGPGMPPQVDSRQMSLFGGCWTAGSLKYICESGADSVTYFETAGERGIIQGDRDSKWPLYFQSIKGMIFPAYHVFKFLLGNKSMNFIKSISSKPLAIDCFALTDGKQVRIILVNFTGSSQSLKFECCSGMFRVRTLNTDSFGDAVSDPRWNGIDREKVIKSDSIFDLDPYSINFIEGWRKH